MFRFFIFSIRSPNIIPTELDDPLFTCPRAVFHIFRKKQKSFSYIRISYVSVGRREPVAIVIAPRTSRSAVEFRSFFAHPLVNRRRNVPTTSVPHGIRRVAGHVQRDRAYNQFREQRGRLPADTGRIKAEARFVPHVRFRLFCLTRRRVRIRFTPEIPFETARSETAKRPLGRRKRPKRAV